MFTGSQSKVAQKTLTKAKRLPTPLIHMLPCHDLTPGAPARRVLNIQACPRLLCNPQMQLDLLYIPAPGMGPFTPSGAKLPSIRRLASCFSSWVGFALRISGACAGLLGLWPMDMPTRTCHHVSNDNALLEHENLQEFQGQSLSCPRGPRRISSGQVRKEAARYFHQT